MELLDLASIRDRNATPEGITPEEVTAVLDEAGEMKDHLRLLLSSHLWLLGLATENRPPRERSLRLCLSEMFTHSLLARWGMEDLAPPLDPCSEPR